MLREKYCIEMHTPNRGAYLKSQTHVLKKGHFNYIRTYADEAWSIYFSVECKIAI